MTPECPGGEYWFPYYLIQNNGELEQIQGTLETGAAHKTKTTGLCSGCSPVRRPLFIRLLQLLEARTAVRIFRYFSLEDDGQHGRRSQLA